MEQTARDKPAEFKQWGTGWERQYTMNNACDYQSQTWAQQTPILAMVCQSRVLATRNSVIPYAVGVDIACRVKLSVLDLPPEMLENEKGMKQP